MLVIVILICFLRAWSIDTDVLVETISDALRDSANVHCKAWDHKKCKAVDYVYSFKNRSSTLTFGAPCTQKGRSHYSILEWKQGLWTVPSCIQNLERGLVIFSRTRISPNTLDTEILPRLISCCSLSFDAISSYRLHRTIARIHSVKNMDDVYLYFFVRDECIISLTKSKMRTTRNSDFGIMMCSNSRFLGTAKSAIDVVRKEAEYEIDMILPDDILNRVPTNYFGSSLILTKTVDVPNCILPSLESEYGFRMHKLPMLLQGQHENNLYLDSDVYVCGSRTIENLRQEMNDRKNATVFCIQEGIRAVDKVNYVHGGILGWRLQSPLALAFLKTWLRLYLVHYQHHQITRRGRGSIYEQPSLTLTAKYTQSVVGAETIHFWDSSMLLRSHLQGGLSRYRQNLKEKGYAANLVHVNPLKQWNLVEEFVVEPGCGNFTRNSLARSQLL